MLLASVFAKYLQHLFDSAPGHVRISVICPTAISKQPTTYKEGITGLLFSSGDPESAGLELRVHAPQFYRQMITYGKLTEMLSYTLLDPCEENHTAWSNDGKGLIAALQEMESVEANQKHQAGRRHRLGLVSQITWAAFARLRHVQKPLESAYPEYGYPGKRAAGFSKSANIIDSRLAGCGEYFLDDFVRFHCGSFLQIRFMLASVGLIWRARIMNIIGGE